MKSLVLILVVLVVVFVFYYAYVSTRLFKWKISFLSIIPRDFGKILEKGASADLKLGVSLTNPSIFGFKLRELNLNLFHNNIEITRTSLPISSIKINSNGTSFDEVNLNIPMNNELVVVINKYLAKEVLKIKYVISYKIYFLEITNEGFFEYKNEGK